MTKNELLVDYCQRCGAEIGSFDCCQSSTNKSLRSEPVAPRIEHHCPNCGGLTKEAGCFCNRCLPDNSHAFHHGVDCYGNAGIFEDFEQSIGE